MTFDELEVKLSKLMSLPLRSQIQVNFDEEEKTFSLSIPIFHPGNREISPAVQKYVAARKGMAFQPYLTSYQYIENLNQIHLIQKLPFTSDDLSSLRRQLADFWVLSKKCHTLLCELAAEEKLELLEDHT